MNCKGILFMIVVMSLLIGSASASGANDFKIDQEYKTLYDNPNYSLHLNSANDAGVAVLKNVDGDIDAYDNLVHDAHDYITGDEKIHMDKQFDNTGVFEDVEHAVHGTVELVKKGGEEYVAVFFAKDTSNVKYSYLESLLKDFNKENNLEAIAF